MTKVPADAIVVAIRSPNEVPARPYIPMHIEIAAPGANPGLAAQIRPMPDELAWDDPVRPMGIATPGPDDRLMTWMPHDGNILFGYLMSPNRKHEEVQYRAFLRCAGNSLNFVASATSTSPL